MILQQSSLYEPYERPPGADLPRGAKGLAGPVESQLAGAWLGRTRDAAPVGEIAPLLDGDAFGARRDLVRLRRDLAELVEGLDQCAEGDLGTHGQSRLGRARRRRSAVAFDLDDDAGRHRLAVIVNANLDDLERR